MWREWLSSARSDEDDEDSPEIRHKRLLRRRRWVLIGAGMALVLVVSGLTLYHFGGGWLEDRTRTRVQGYLEQQDYRRVQLTLEQAVQVSPHSLAARRALAEFYETAGSPLSVALWREAVALAPNDDQLRLKLAGVSLRLEGVRAARAELDAVSAAARNTLDYHRLAAGVALAENNAVELQQQLTAMAALEPDNLRTKITLASLQLRSPDPAIAAGARADLEGFARGEKFRIHATLTLIRALPGPIDETALQGLATRILPVPVTPAWFALIEHMKSEPHPSAEDAAALANWMILRGLAREALVWIATQPAATSDALPVLAARANAAAQLHDWRLLRQLVSDGAWGRLSADAIELAFAARLQRERAGVANGKETFADAIEIASPSLPTLKALDRLCGIWGWPEESERVLTRVTRDFPREESAWQELLARAQTGEKSTRYWELVRRHAQVFPNDLAAQALHTYAAVITGQSDPEMRKTALAALGKEDAPPEEIAAGVLLRWREKSAAEAIAGLSPHQIEVLKRSPKGLLVFAAASSAAGKDVKELLARLPVDRLLPEERALLPRTATADRHALPQPTAK